MVDPIERNYELQVNDSLSERATLERVEEVKLPELLEASMPDQPSVHESEGHSISNRSYKWKWVYEDDFDEHSQGLKDVIEERERQLLAALKENARLKANPRVGDCIICGTSIWRNQQRMDKGSGMFHLLCEVDRKLQTAEAELARLRGKS